MAHVTKYGQLVVAGLLVCGLAQPQTDIFSFSVFRNYSLNPPPEAVSFSADGKRMALLSGGKVLLLGTDDGARRVLPTMGSTAELLALSRNGDRVAVGLSSRKIQLTGWDGASGAEIMTRRGRITALTFAPDSSVLAYALDKTVVIADTLSGRELQHLSSEGRGIVCFLGFRGGGATLVGATDSGKILEWDAKRGTSLRRLQDDDASVFAVALSRSSDLLALSTEFATLNSGNPYRSAHPSDFYRENRLKLYDLKRGAVVKQIDGIDGQLRALSFSADGRFVAAVRQKQRSAFVSVYDVQRGVEIAALPTDRESRVVEFSADGAWLAATSPDGSLTVFAVSGVQRGTTAEDLTGSKIQITSGDRGHLISPRSRMTIAVMDLQPLGVPAEVSGAVSEMLRNRLSGSPNLEMVERERMQRIMAEQNFQNSDRADFQMAARLGRLLTAQKMIFGSVSRLGGTFTIGVQVVDVETARVDGIREVLCQRCTLEDLPAAMAELKASLVAVN